MKTHAPETAISYTLHGKVEAPVLVLAHALAANSAMWRSHRVALEESYRVLSYDIRGHGASGGPSGGCDLDALADDAERLMDSLDLGEVQWVGVGLGGMIGQALALRGSQHVGALVLAGSMAEPTEGLRSTLRERVEIATEQGTGALREAILGDWLTEGFRQMRQRAVEEAEDQILATTVSGFVHCCEAILGLDHLDRLVELDLPVLVVVGAEDRVSSVRAAWAMHERIAGSRLEIVRSAAHLCAVEQPELFDKLVLEFLR